MRANALAFARNDDEHIYEIQALRLIHKVHILYKNCLHFPAKSIHTFLH
ncbi:hypothetical protein [Helicobacter sp. MIT 01-3238]|nr:hypothetical protein [Helicobacter sp. MIT 01-3238]